jgi:hypothetical protein
VASLSPCGMEAKRKQVRIGRQVAGAVPEAEVIYPWPGRSIGKTMWRTEQVKLENFSDELRVGVKG